MKYQWLESGNMTCEELSNELGLKVKRIIRGDIVIKNKNGTSTRQGIEIEFEDTLKDAVLQKLDVMMPNMKRIK